MSLASQDQCSLLLFVHIAPPVPAIGLESQVCQILLCSKLVVLRGEDVTLGPLNCFSVIIC